MGAAVMDDAVVEPDKRRSWPLRLLRLAAGMLVAAAALAAVIGLVIFFGRGIGDEIIYVEPGTTTVVEPSATADETTEPASDPDPTTSPTVFGPLPPSESPEPDTFPA